MKTNEPFRVVCCFDPAIDASKMSLDQAVEYGRTRDMKLLDGALKDGERPMVFEVRPATRSHEAHVMAGATEAEKNERAFACLVTACKDMWTMDCRRVDKDFTSARSPSAIMTDAELESVPYVVRQEIGQVAHTRACFLVPWTEPRYLLPPGSASVLVQRYESTSHADESRQSSTSDTTESSSGPLTEEAKGRDEVRAEHMDVPAAVG